MNAMDEYLAISNNLISYQINDDCQVSKFCSKQIKL